MTEPPPDASTANETLEQFAASVAHDFNNLLTGILGNLELMQNRATRKGVMEFDTYLEGARHAGGRAAIFAQRLLAFSGRATDDPRPVEIDGLIQEIVEPMREHGVALVLELGCGNAKLLCDPAQAELALHELLDNAADSIGKSGEVRLTTALSAGILTIAICDTGPGMPPEILARAVDPFFTTRPNGAGKGLGLCIADRFARHAGGRLHLASAPGQGTTASLVLPVG